jgi:predicted phosphoribosyltransferase
MLLRDRSTAGLELGRELGATERFDPIVLGLPRGGVPVAYGVATALEAPLDVLVVRKLGVPGHEELAMGAVGEAGVRVLDSTTIDDEGVGRRELGEVERRERARVARQAESFRAGRAAVPLRGRTVVLVDDGVATGSTMVAACRVARAHHPQRIVVAVPVAPAPALDVLRGEADDVVCLHTPHPFMAVGLWYHDFTQVSDETVVALLHRAAELRDHR